MRRLTGFVAAGLGTFLLVVALLMHFYVPGVITKFPLNTYTVSTLVGHNVSYFSPSQLTELSGVTMRATNTTEGDGSAGNSVRAVYNAFNYVYDETNKQSYSYSTNRFPFDRKTGLLVNCCQAAVGTNTHVHLSGLGLLFPLGVKQQTYQVFNTTLLKPVAARYVGQQTIDGLTTYKFVTQIPPTNVGTQEIPGSLIGSSQAAATLNEYFGGTTSYFVDPTTGVPVKVIEQQHVGLRDSSGRERLVLLDGTLTSTPSTTQNLVNTVNRDVNLLHVATNTAPLVAGILALILLIGGLIIVAISGGEEYEESEGY
jgi:hypothetical protein